MSFFTSKRGRFFYKKIYTVYFSRVKGSNIWKYQREDDINELDQKYVFTGIILCSILNCVLILFKNFYMVSH